MVGLDITGAFGSASLPRLMRTLNDYRLPEVLRRLLGKGAAARSFRAKVTTPVGAGVCSPRWPISGATEGGDLLTPPQIKKIAVMTQAKIEGRAPVPKIERNGIVQISTDGASWAVARAK